MTQRSRNIRWLEGELERWVGNDIIDNTHAEAIRRLYPAEKVVRPWALIVFSGVGAVIIGLGVILLFAYNWQYMSKFAKLAIIFAAIAVAHSIGTWLFLHSDRFRGLGEAFTVLGTMFFGAGIWLVAQIYHIEEHYPNAFFLWGLGAMLLAWALPSIAQAILSAVLFSIWAGVEAIEFERAMYAALPLILLLYPLAYLKRSRVLLGILILSFGFSTGFIASAYTNEIVFNILLSVAAIYVSLGLLNERYGKFPQSALIFHIFGFGAYLVMLYLLTFPDMAKEVLAIGPTWDATLVLCWRPMLYWLSPFVLSLAAWAVVVWLLSPWRRKPTLRNFPYDLFLVPPVLILCYYYSFFLRDYNHWAVAAPFNLVFLAHAGNMMARGCREGQLGPTILGSLLLVVLTVARFMDLFESLAARGVVFIIVGAMLFCQGIFYVRSKKKRVKTEVK